MEEKKRFARFVARYTGVVCATAYSATRDRALSEEVAQETFLVAWQKLPALDRPPVMPAWLCGIARNLARNARRRGWRERAGEVGHARAGGPSPLDTLLARERDLLVGRALARVPVKYREPLVMFYRSGKSVRVVADALGLEPATVRQRLARGRRHLRREVDLVERELPRSRPGAGFVAAVVGSLGITRRRSIAAPLAATTTRITAALLPAAALCGVLVTASIDEPARAAAPTNTSTTTIQDPRSTPTSTPTPTTTPHAPRSTRTPTPTPTPTPTRTPTRTPVPAPAPAPASGPAPAIAAAPGRSRTLQRALELYRRGRYESASIELYKVVQKETQDSAADRQLAGFTLGKTLYRMGFPTGALSYFEAIADAGPSHPYYRTALRWLGALAQKLPDPSGVATRVADYPADALDDSALASVRDQLLYLLARHHLADPDPHRALALLDRIGADSPRYPEARLLAGVMHVRARDGSRAARAFEQAARAGSPELADRARLDLARLYYSTGDYDRSIAGFESVRRRSPLWSTALLEAAWAYFRAGHPELGLGNLHTLASDYFAGEYFPEAARIAATTYFAHCHFERAEAITREFDRRYRPLLAGLRRIARLRADDDAGFARYARRLRESNPPPDPRRFGPATAGPAHADDSAEGLAATALRDRELDRKFAQVDAITEEIHRLERSDPAWRMTGVAVDAMQVATLQQSLAEAAAGTLARRRIARLIDDITAVRGDLLRIRIEVLNRRAVRAGRDAPRAEPAPRIYAIDDQGSFWPWQGEYWRDELGRYYVEVESICAH